MFGSCAPFCCLYDCVASILFPLSVVADLQQANLLTSQSGIILMEPMDVVKVQCHCSPEVVPKSAEVLRGHGFGKVSNILLGNERQTRALASTVTCIMLHK